MLRHLTRTDTLSREGFPSAHGGMALEGMISLAVGVTVLVWPEISGLALLYVIAAWAGITGILEIVAGSSGATPPR